MREMKNCGIEWIGDIPADWTTTRISSLYSLRNEKVSDKEYQPLSVTMKGILPQLETAAKTNDGDNRKLVRKGDFAINSRSDRRGSCGISDYNGSVSLINTVLTPRNNMNPGFYNWLFHSTAFSDEFYCWGHGIVDDLWTTHWQDMKKITIPVPPLNEQKNIAEYLDTRCAEIDALTADIESQIETLEQYKRSIITEAVTKGLNPDTGLKNSGIKWIGEIGENFIITRLKYLCDNLDEFREPIAADKRNQNSNVLYDYYGASGVIDKINGYTIDDHVMLIGEDGANLRMRNLPIMYEVNGKAWINNHAHILKPKINVDFKFLFFALESLDINPYITGSAQPKLNQENLNNMWVAVPSYEEQCNISSFLNQKCTKIDNIIKGKKKQLDILVEYKKSLIYEYVTGKKEVPTA